MFSFNDFADRPSTSLAQKRPSPIINDCLRSSKRHNSSRKESAATNSTNTMSTEKKEESEVNVLTNDGTADKTNQSIDIAIETNESDCDDEEEDEHDEDDNAKAGESSRAIESTNKWYSKPMPLSCKKLPIKPNSSYLSEDFIAKLKTEWTNTEANGVDRKSTDINGNVKLYNKPFKICLVQEFLQNKIQVQRMVYEMCQMEWQRKQMDLYEFHQTTDLVNISAFSKPNLRKFFNMMSTDILPWMRKITGLQLTHISASCSMYNYSDYLLVHDDLLSDRQIAFVYYLSPWFEQWTDEMGGALELFECDENTNQPKYPIAEKFPPRNDQFVFFRVCKQSFHQVGEVTNLVYPRLTINGWFHGPSSDNNDTQDDISMTDNEESNNFDVNDAEEMVAPLNDEINLSEWIDPIYLNNHTKASIQQHIEDKSEASLELFLIQDFFDLLLSEFRENTELNWTLEGPANQQKYETLHFTAHSTGPPKDLYTLFASKTMFGLLHEYTALDFDGLHAKIPSCSVKICRFTQGCYTLLGSASTYNDSALEVILFFGAKEGVGKITYLNPSEDPNEYNTTVDTDATVSSMDVSDSYINNSLGNSSTMNVGLASQSTAHVNWKRPLSQTELKMQKTITSAMKLASVAASTSKLMKIDRETSSDMSLDETSSSHDPQDAEVNAIMHNSSSTDKDSDSSKMETSVPNHSMDNNDSEEEDEAAGSDSSSSVEVLPLSDDEYDELAHEESLLTIHPRNNSLNLVYRLAGQTKFIKYISKNALKPDEYIYILMATYKE